MKKYIYIKKSTLWIVGFMASLSLLVVSFIIEVDSKNRKIQDQQILIDSLEFQLKLCKNNIIEVDK